MPCPAIPSQASELNLEGRMLDKIGVSGSLANCENIVKRFSWANTKSQKGESFYYASDPSNETK